jgi:hypothetical protein
MNIIRLLLILFVALLIGATTASAQTTDCPPDKVCLTREAAIKAVTDAKQVEADKALIDALNKAVADYKQQFQDLRVQLAETGGENTQLKQEQVRTNAIIDLLLKSVRAKKIGLLVF